MRRLTLGRVAGVYGVKGWVKLLSFTRPLEDLLEYRRWWIASGDGYEAQLVEGRLHGQGIVAQLTGPDGRPIDDRDVAARLIGAEMQVERSRLPPPPEGQFYWADLEGLKVQNLEGVELGMVESVTSNGAQDVLAQAGRGGAADPLRARCHRALGVAAGRVDRCRLAAGLLSRASED